MNNDNINKKSDSFNFTDVVKKINSDSEGTPWYKKKVSIISMSSVLGVGALATVIAVPIALTSGNTSSTVTNKDWTVSNIKSIYDLNEKYAKLIIRGEKLPPNVSSYKVFSSTITNKRGPITSVIKTQVGNDVQLGFNDSTLVATTKYEVVIDGHSTPIIEQHILQPIINIGTQPTSQTIASTETNKRVTLTVAATVQNQISGKSLTYQWQNSDRNDVSSFENISSATSASYEVDATSFPDATKKYYRCVVSYEHTEAKPSSTVFVEKAAGTVTPPPPVVTPAEAIAAFNKKPKDEKLNAYNSIMANTTNNTAIKDYFLKNAGMSKFFNENVLSPNSSSPQELSNYNTFKNFLPTYNISNISASEPIFKPSTGDNFLSIKAIEDDKGSNVDKPDNIYCSQQIESVLPSLLAYNFYSALKSSITNVTMSNDYSITMTISNPEKNFSFILIRSDLTTSRLNYKSTIKFSNTTLFPGMSDFVKTNILKLKA
ncbi:MAG: hypothetical protein RSE26_03305 [Malacoplasma sp.]